VAGRREAAREEEARLRRLNQKFQGEAAFLRSQLQRRDQEAEAERQARRQAEGDLQERLAGERGARQAEVAAVKTEKLFILQEMEQLKERLRTEEARPAPRPRQAAIQKSEFPAEAPRPRSSASTQTEAAGRPRAARLGRGGPPRAVAVRSLCSLAPLRPEDKARLLLAASDTAARGEVAAVVGRALASLRAGAGQEADRLTELHCIMDICGDLVPAEQRTTITEVCSDLLSRIIKERSPEAVPQVLHLLCAAWGPGLQEPDITAFVLALLARLVTTVRLPDSPRAVQHLMELVGRVAADPVQAGLLCRQGQEDCFLACLPALVRRAEAGRPEVQRAAGSALAHWLLAVTSISPAPPYLTTGCHGCSGGLVAAATHVAKLQVRRLAAPGGAGCPGVLAAVRDILAALGRQQEVLRGPGGEDAAWLDLVSAGAGLQRSYMWAMNTAGQFAGPLGEEAAARLELLRLEQQGEDSGEEEKPAGV
jgi:hypothetical protein